MRLCAKGLGTCKARDSTCGYWNLLRAYTGNRVNTTLPQPSTQGFHQVEGIDYFETYAPVANIVTVRTALAVAAFKNWELEMMDVDTAFHNAPVDEEIYVAMPPGYEETSAIGRFVYKLRRSLYGLKQAPKNWNSYLNEWLVNDFGFARSAVDSCLVRLHQRHRRLSLSGGVR